MAVMEKRRRHAALLAFLTSLVLWGPACVFDTDDDGAEVEQIEDDEEDADVESETEVEVEDEETP